MILTLSASSLSLYQVCQLNSIYLRKEQRENQLQLLERESGRQAGEREILLLLFLFSFIAQQQLAPCFPPICFEENCPLGTETSEPYLNSFHFPELVGSQPTSQQQSVKPGSSASQTEKPPASSVFHPSY